LTKSFATTLLMKHLPAMLLGLGLAVLPLWAVPQSGNAVKTTATVTPSAAEAPGIPHLVRFSGVIRDTAETTLTGTLNDSISNSQGNPISTSESYVQANVPAVSGEALNRSLALEGAQITGGNVYITELQDNSVQDQAMRNQSLTLLQHPITDLFPGFKYLSSKIVGYFIIAGQDVLYLFTPSERSYGPANPTCIRAGIGCP
jgi:hypothetical protein